MYPKKTKEFQTSNLEIFIDFKDFIKFSIKEVTDNGSLQGY